MPGVWDESHPHRVFKVASDPQTGCGLKRNSNGILQGACSRLLILPTLTAITRAQCVEKSNRGAGLSGPLLNPLEACENMDDDDQFLNQVLSGIAEAEIITIFFPLLRRALVIDTRHNESMGHMVRVLPQVGSMEERIAVIERMRSQFGKVRSILGIPWIKSINSLREQGIVERLVERLSD